MLNDSQQRKALVLSLLMVMLAQTAYIEAYRGWKPPVELQEEDEQDVQRVASPSVCAATSRPTGMLWLIDTKFTGPIAVSNHRPTALFGVETKVGKSSA